MNLMPRIFAKICLGIGLVLLIASCGANNADTDFSVPIKMSSSITAAELNLKNSNTKLVDKNSPQIPIDSYVLEISSCTSGQTGKTSDESLKVTMQDTNCLAKLVSFKLSGQAYEPKGAGAADFKTWLAGDTAIFQGIDSADLIKVKVVSQLSSPIADSDLVSYLFTIASSTKKNSEIIGTGQNITIAGQDAPNFTINANSFTFVNINKYGAGEFSFTLTCSSGPMTMGKQPGKKTFCPTIAGGSAGVDVYANSNSDPTSLFSYVLILDPQNGGKPGTLTAQQAKAAFTNGGTTVSLADLNPSSTAAISFTTQTLIGPGQMFVEANRFIILVLQAKSTNPSLTDDPANSSFQYFPITLPPINL